MECEQSELTAFYASCRCLKLDETPEEKTRDGGMLDVDRKFVYENPSHL